jgi:hypothetical protein
MKYLNILAAVLFELASGKVASNYIDFNEGIFCNLCHFAMTSNFILADPDFRKFLENMAKDQCAVL